VRVAASPVFMEAKPSSQPLITWPWPMVNLKGFPRETEESNCDPSDLSVPYRWVDFGFGVGGEMFRCLGGVSGSGGEE